MPSTLAMTTVLWANRDETEVVNVKFSCGQTCVNGRSDEHKLVIVNFHDDCLRRSSACYHFSPQLRYSCIEIVDHFEFKACQLGDSRSKQEMILP
jgi:hypothetical protein